LYADGAYWCAELIDSNGPYCAEQVWSPNGNPDGLVVFVKIDCLTREPLPMDQQDPAYAAPGVALPRSAFDTMMADWVDNTCMYWQVTTSFGEQNAFEIHGKNFAGDKLGENGDNLKETIQACGQFGCEWAFNITPDDDNWNWKATGCLPITARPGCIGDAILAVGGKTKDGCH